MKEMYSEINTQACTVERICVPAGKGIATNSSPSLLPIRGSLAIDSTVNQLYMANGSTWNRVRSTTAPSSVGNITAQFTLTASSMPSLNVQCYFTKTTTPNISPLGTGYFATMVILIDQTINITANDEWSNTGFIVNQQFWPQTDTYFPISVRTPGGTYSTIQGNLNATGQLSITSRAGNVGLTYFGNIGVTYLPASPLTPPSLEDSPEMEKDFVESKSFILEGKETPKESNDEYCS